MDAIVINFDKLANALGYTYGDMDTRELLERFDELPVDKAAELYVDIAADTRLIARMIKAVLNRSPQINRIKEIVPEVFV